MPSSRLPAPLHLRRAACLPSTLPAPAPSRSRLLIPPLLSAPPLSWPLAGAAFPAFTTSLVAIKSILLFNRSGVKDTEASLLLQLRGRGRAAQRSRGLRCAPAR